MKYTISLFVILLPAFARAQSKAAIDSTARSLLNELVNSWTLGIDSAAEGVDIKVYNKFKSLFDANATIDEDFNVVYLYDPKKRSGDYRVRADAKTKTFDEYAHDVTLQLRSLAIDSVAVLDFNTGGRTMTFTVSRRVKLQKPGKYVLPGSYAAEVIGGRTIEMENKTDSLKIMAALKAGAGKNQEAIYEFTSLNTIRVTIAYQTDSARITQIQSLANEVVCTNDADGDAVVNQEDLQPDKAGDFTASGKPDYDLDGVADDKDKCRLTYGEAKNQGCPPTYFLTKNRLNGFIGLQLNMANIRLPELNQLGYTNADGTDAVDVNNSRKGKPRNPGGILSVYGGGNFTHYFGQKRKKSGIAVGFAYTGFSAKYGLLEPVKYMYRAVDGLLHEYRRQITIRASMEEEIRYSILSIPLLFDYRLHADKKQKLVFNLQAGPSLLLFNNTSAYNAGIDFEGWYQYNQGTGAFANKDPFSPDTSSYVLHFTAAYLDSKNQGANAAIAAFTLLDSIRYTNAAQFDFASKKSFAGKQQIRRLAIAANLNVNFHYKVSEGLTVKLGSRFMYAPYLPVKTKYKPVDRTTDTYQSLYKSNARSSYSAYGLNIGFVYDF